MAENKPERRKSPLYNDRGSDKDVRSKEEGKPSTGKDSGKMSEPKGKDGDGVRPKEAGKPSEGKDDGKMAEPKAEGEKPVHERHAEERAAMHKQHETERRDMHGTHREEHRLMHARHEKAHKDMMAKQEGELTAASGPTDGLQAGGEAAPSGQAPAAGGEPTVQATQAA